MQRHQHPISTLPSLVTVLLVMLALNGIPFISTSAQTEIPTWGTYRSDNGRSGYVSAKLPAMLQVKWNYQLSPPAPAWPPPATKSYWQNLDKIEPRVIDDQAFHPVVDEEIVLIGSSADDSVHCFNTNTGELQWRFTTDGPVRYAPAIWADRVLIASDDGFLRCVERSTGELIWKKRVGPEAKAIPGNGRIISPYPLRSGVLVANGMAFTCAGLFPSQGVFAAAYDIASGENVWRRDLGNRSPQGYLLATRDRLIVPSGRGNPFSLRLDDGRDGPSFQGNGGTFAVIEDQRLVSGRGNDNSLVGSNASSGERIVTFPGEHLVVTPSDSYLANGTSIAAVDRATSNQLKAELAEVERRLRADNENDSLVQRRRQIQVAISKCIRWTVESERVLSMTATDDVLIVGLSGALEIREASDGTIRQRIPLEGEARSIAAIDGSVIVTTDRGEVIALGTEPNSIATGEAPSDQERVAESIRSKVARWISSADTSVGYLIAIEPSIDELFAATEHPGFRIVAYYSSNELLQQARDRMRQRGLYGTRVAIHAYQSTTQLLPLDDHIANVVIDSKGSLPPAELERIAAPGRSVVIRAGDVSHPPRLPNAGSWTHQFANLANTSNSQDGYTTSALQLKWFGGPGPRRMVDRHLRAPPPLASAGRTFVIGENRIIGIDSYNGVELWDTALPDSQRYAMPYDAGYIACREDSVFAAVDEEVWQIDANSGDVIARINLPEPLDTGLHWGYVGIDSDHLYGTAMLPTAPRTVPGRHLSDQTYRSEQPTVTSRAIFCVDLAHHSQGWQYQRGVILNTSIAIRDNMVCFIEARGDASRLNELGRMPLSELLADDPWLVVLNATTGELIWERRVDLPDCRNIVYVLATEGRFLIVGSRDSDHRDAQYHLRCVDANDGEELWRTSHENQQPGQLYHGEQVHHPVILGDTLVAEPYLYDLNTGETIVPEGESNDWYLKRPGHSCGTMSGARDCLFFRASNPTVMDLKSSPDRRFQSLSPSRVGCWINILPADGLVIIPEASSSCVCHFSLQTSMAFRPVQKEEQESR